MSLVKYRRKRDFKKTPEPAGSAGSSGPRFQFVIQKHAARRLHYDFRLELDGTLKSWAVPKGPSLDPADKRLAVHVEDHPLEYGKFEGIIPEKQYGAGAVILWDRGTWTPVGDARRSYRAGALKFKLRGAKLKGGWALVRMNGRAAAGKENWLLIKERDQAARPGEGTKLVDERPESVVTVKTIETLGEGVQNDGKKRVAKNKPENAQQHDRAGDNAVPAKRVRAAAAASKTSKPADARVGGVQITHPDRIVYPEAKLTKLDVARYYERLAPRILPYIGNRPLSIVRCPSGARSACFFQKHASESAIQGIEVAMIEDGAGRNPYIVANRAEALVGLAQRGTLELHVWNATIDQIERPDMFVIDFDPDAGLPWVNVVEAARATRQLLDELGLKSFLKTTGGKGLHVVVPLARRGAWDEVKSFARDIALRLVDEFPARFTAVASKARRKDKIFVDYLRNGRGATAVAPYSLRARAGATVAMPLAWDELTPSLRPDAYTLATVEKVLAKRRDPWAQFASVRQTITAKMKRAVGQRRAAR